MGLLLDGVGPHPCSLHWPYDQGCPWAVFLLVLITLYCRAITTGLKALCHCGFGDLDDILKAPLVSSVQNAPWNWTVYSTESDPFHGGGLSALGGQSDGVCRESCVHPAAGPWGTCLCGPIPWLFGVPRSAELWGPGLRPFPPSEPSRVFGCREAESLCGDARAPSRAGGCAVCPTGPSQGAGSAAWKKTGAFPYTEPPARVW